MSVAIQLDRDAERPERRIICPDCGELVLTRGPAKKYCDTCAGIREAKRQGDRHRQPEPPVAPQLRIATEDTSPTIAAAYETWRIHHAHCGVCGKHDWFEPGAPRLCAPDDVVRSRILRLTDGRVVGVVDGADVAVLCAAGRERFQGWVRAAMLGIRLGGRA